MVPRNVIGFIRRHLNVLVGLNWTCQSATEQEPLRVCRPHLEDLVPLPHCNGRLANNNQPLNYREHTKTERESRDKKKTTETDREGVTYLAL